MKYSITMNSNSPLSFWHEAGAGYWSLVIDNKTKEVLPPTEFPRESWDQDGNLLINEWHLVHCEGCIYEIEYAPDDTGCESMFRGRIQTPFDLWGIMARFPQFDETRRWISLRKTCLDS